MRHSWQIPIKSAAELEADIEIASSSRALKETIQNIRAMQRFGRIQTQIQIALYQQAFASPLATVDLFLQICRENIIGDSYQRLLRRTRPGLPDGHPAIRPIVHMLRKDMEKQTASFPGTSRLIEANEVMYAVDRSEASPDDLLYFAEGLISTQPKIYQQNAKEIAANLLGNPAFPDSGLVFFFQAHSEYGLPELVYASDRWKNMPKFDRRIIQLQAGLAG